MMKLNERHVVYKSGSGNLRGVLHEPSTVPDGKHPIVILCLGLNGNRCDLNRITVDLCRALQQKGFFCLRYDSYGLGMSDGYFSEATIESKVDDLICTYNYAQEFSKDICVITLSDGLQILSSALAQNSQMTQASFVFWSPILTDSNDIGAIQTLARAYRDKRTGKICTAFLGLDISLQYLREKRTCSFVQDFACASDSISKRTLFIYAENDQHTAESVRILEKYGIKHIRLWDGGHSFCTSHAHTAAIVGIIDWVCALTEHVPDGSTEG